MRVRAWLVVLGAFAVNAQAAQLFIAVDEDGNPLETAAAPAEVSVGADDLATPPTLISQNMGEESRFAEDRKTATLAYIACLKEEDDRWLGGTLESCNAARDELVSFLPDEVAPGMLGCLEEDVLGHPRDGILGCEWLRSNFPAEIRIGVRWP